MADDNTIIEGTVKFRDGKKWKSRWCVMRKLSPAADCVHLQLYRDSKARWGGAGGCKASLSLQQFLGCETGFTLDKHSNTLALVCTDLVAILAFDTRERLIQWQVKVNAHLGSARHYLVLVGPSEPSGGGGGGTRLSAGPARLLLRERRVALTAGVPPRLLGVWELAHLRRYGVVEGRFCFEGGSHCGKGEGLHVLITDQAKEIATDFDLASRGLLSPRRRLVNLKKNDGAESPKSHKAFRPDTRLSELSTIDNSLPPLELRLHEDRCAEDVGAMSPYWPSMERPFQDMGHGDTASVNETIEGTNTSAWAGGTGKVTLERCMSCMSKLGAMSRSSTAALTPGAKHFSPAWTMDALYETYSEASTNAQSSEGASSTIDKTENVCRCPSADRVPGRPPKPTRLELNLNKKPRMPLPTHACSCCSRVHAEENKSRVGPYENYDVPKLASIEVNGEYYDTPKRLKECLNNELFQITKSSTPNAVILKKPCGCLLKFGRRRKEPTVVDTDDNIQPAACPCQRVTDWANSWIKLPYSRKNTVSSDNLAHNKENSKPSSALYATIDLSRKTRRKTHPIEPDERLQAHPHNVEIDEGPLANYENLNFALSLEYYENAKDLLRRAGVTQSELDAISANLIPPELPAKLDRDLCKRCGHPPPHPDKRSETSTTGGDDYLMMEPKSIESGKLERSRTPPPAGYTPMSPLGALALHAPPRPPPGPLARLSAEKSASNPTLCADDEATVARPPRAAGDRADRRKRSSSADSSRFLEDVKEFEGSVGSRGSSSSIETLRNLVVADAGACRCAAGSGKHSDADSSEASRGAGGGRGRGGQQRLVELERLGRVELVAAARRGAGGVRVAEHDGGRAAALPLGAARGRLLPRLAAEEVEVHGPAARRRHLAAREDPAQVLLCRGGGSCSLCQISKRYHRHAQHVERHLGHVGLHRDALHLLLAFLDGHSHHDEGGARHHEHAAAALRQGVPAAHAAPRAPRAPRAPLLQPAVSVPARLPACPPARLPACREGPRTSCGTRTLHVTTTLSVLRCYFLRLLLKL